MTVIFTPLLVLVTVMVRLLGRLTEIAIERPRKNGTTMAADQVALHVATRAALYQARVFNAYPQAAYRAIQVLRWCAR